MSRKWVVVSSSGRFLTVIALVLSLLSLNMSQPSITAQAGVFTVTKTADTADGSCNADCSLREAIVAANAHSGADVINVPAGIYTLTIAGSMEDLGLTGDLDVIHPVTINGAGAGATIIDGNALDRVFQLQAAVVLKGMTVRNGRAPDGTDGVVGTAGTPGAACSPGGIGSDGTDGTDGEDGGGIHAIFDLTLDNVIVYDNRAGNGGHAGSGGVGGAGGACPGSSSAGNGGDGGTGGDGGDGGMGGGIFLLSPSSALTLTNSSRISFNQAGGGGNGGAGGAGGAGGEHQTSGTGSGGNGGTGGPSGRGGNGGAGGGVVSYSRMHISGGVVYRNYAGSGGAGGKAGDGGAAGASTAPTEGAAGLAGLAGESYYGGAGGPGGGIYSTNVISATDVAITLNRSGQGGPGGFGGNGGNGASGADGPSNGAAGSQGESGFPGGRGGGLFVERINNSPQRFVDGIDSIDAVPSYDIEFVNCTFLENSTGAGGSGGWGGNGGNSPQHGGEGGHGGRGAFAGFGGGAFISNYEVSFQQTVFHENSTGHGGDGGGGGNGGNSLSAGHGGDGGNGGVGFEGGSGAGLSVDNTRLASIRTQYLSNLLGAGGEGGTGGTGGTGTLPGLHGSDGDNGDAGDGGGIATTGGQNILVLINTVVANNIAPDGSTEHESSTPGLYLLDCRATMIHLTLAYNHGGNGAGALVSEQSKVQITNTIVASHTMGIAVAPGSSVTADYILWDGNTSDSTGTITGTNYYTGAVRFKNPAMNNFRVLCDSAAINKGVEIAVYDDLDGQVRPWGAAYDLGADEFRWLHVFIPVVRK